MCYLQIKSLIPIGGWKSIKQTLFECFKNQTKAKLNYYNICTYHVKYRCSKNDDDQIDLSNYTRSHLMAWNTNSL